MRGDKLNAKAYLYEVIRNEQKELKKKRNEIFNEMAIGTVCFITLAVLANLSRYPKQRWFLMGMVGMALVFLIFHIIISLEKYSHLKGEMPRKIVKTYFRRKKR